MEVNIAVFILALAMGIPGLFNLLRPERVHFFYERMRYQDPLEPSAFRLRSLRMQGVVLSLASAALMWLGLLAK
jgi:hypothetical protein